MGICASLFCSGKADKETLHKRISPSDDQVESQREYWNDLAEYLKADLKTRSGCAVTSWIFNDWDHEGDREDVAQFLGEKLGLDVALEVTSSAIHGRKLELEYADGRKALVLLDQGFGYWRIVGNVPRYDFRAAPAAQASDLYRSTVAVSGTGESYFAVTRQ